MPVIEKSLIALLIGSLLSFASLPVISEEQKAEDGLWLMQSCRNPRYPSRLARNPDNIDITVLFDINADGYIHDVRLAPTIQTVSEANTNTYLNAVKLALKNWRYFAYLKDGTESPRSDVTLTFQFRKPATEHKKQDNDSCTISYAGLLSHAGDVQNPFDNLSQCIPPNMPKEQDNNKISGKVTLIVNLDSTGKIISVVPSSTSAPEFSDAAIKAFKQWKYTPFIKDGVSKNRYDLNIDFFFGDAPETAKNTKCTHAAFGTSLSGNKIKTRRQPKIITY